MERMRNNIHCDIEYELSELLNMTTSTFISEKQLNNLSIPQYTSTGGHNGIKLDISGRDKKNKYNYFKIN